jgi:3-oxoacyl-[acyl-carrier protein] reductase
MGLGRLEGKTAIITGAASGIGRATALLFADEGASVCIADWNEEGIKAVEQEIREMGGTAIAMKVDVSNSDDIADMVEATMDAFDRVDILVNNAGINPFSPIIVSEEDEFQKVWEVNAKGIFYACKEVIPIMIDQSYGKIVNVTSIMSMFAGFGQSAYNSSKGAAKMFTQGLTMDLAEYGINVNAVAPGMVRTGLTSGMFSDSKRTEYFEERIPAGRIGEPEDLAGAILFLSTDEASYIHGHTLVVDGGMTAGVK